MIIHSQTDYNSPTTTRYRWGLDVSFHLKIAEMAGNINLSRILKHVCELIYLRHRIEGFSLRRLGETASEHMEIFRAIQTGSMSDAKVKMSKHLKAGMDSTISGIQAGKIDTKMWEKIY